MSAAEEPHLLAQRARAATGLSQAAFGRLLGVSTATISAWEQARRKPTPHRLSHALLRLVANRPEWCVAEPGGIEVAIPPRKQRRAEGVEAKVLAACRELAQGSTACVPLDRLRPRLDLERRLVDEALLRLEREGRVTLEPALFPNHLSQAERAALLEHSDREPRLFVAVPSSR